MLFLRFPSDSSPKRYRINSLFNLSHGDVHMNSVASPSWMKISIKGSKCDKFVQGVTLPVGLAS